MREAGQVVCAVLDMVEEACQPGTSTFELDRIAYSETIKRKAKPAFRGYLGFPNSLCTSINEEVVHGIPSRKRLIAEGDLVKIDFGASVKGWFADSARTVPVGRVSDSARALIQATQDALNAGLQTACSGARLGDVGHAVQVVVEGRGFNVVRDLTGHGIGRSLHEFPRVRNYGEAGTGLLLPPFITLALEPMVNAGTHKVEELEDEWTIVTLDRKWSAHFEHTVVVQDGPAEVLTLRK
jgi:methionyl aminopeptidase